MILEKHHDLVAEQLERYLNAERRELLAVFETLWDKYAKGLFIGLCPAKQNRPLLSLVSLTKHLSSFLHTRHVDKVKASF